MKALLASTILIAALGSPAWATEPNASLHQRALIEKLLDLSKSGDLARSTMDAVFGQMEKGIVDAAEKSGSSPEDIEEAKELYQFIRERAAKIDFAGLLREEYIRIYARHFSEQELADLVAFYESPIGKKSIEVMPQLMREGMQAGAAVIGPRLEEVVGEARQEQDRRRPWRRTMSDIRSVETALEAYVLDHDQGYPNVDYAALEEMLVPTYLASFPSKDIWGNAYAYTASADGQHFRLVSSGSDSIFEWDSRRIATTDAEDEASPIRYRDRLEDDIIFADGSFLQLPVQAKPKDE